MATISHRSFDRRAQQTIQRHRKLARGAVTSVNHDGLIIARPRRAGLRLPYRGLFLLLAAVLLGKAALFNALGPGTYQHRTEALMQGSAVERAGAWMMHADWATRGIAEAMRAVLR